MEISASKDVVIVGGGISGLYLAYILKKHSLSVLLLEASSRLGGRIRTDQTFSSLPIELGAEYVHGKNSTLVEFLSFIEAKMRHEKGNYLYHYKGQLLDFAEMAENPSFEQIDRLFDQLYRYEEEDISIKEYCDREGIPKSMAYIIEAYASVYGSTADQIGMYSTARADRKWSSGSTNFFIDRPFESILDEFVHSLQGDILKTKQVIHIDHHKAKVYLACSDLSFYEARHCVVTVPLGVLKANDIAFYPALPPKKEEAIAKVGFGEGMKVCLKFSHSLCPKNTLEINGGEYAPSYYVRHDAKNEHFVLIAYVMGEKATLLKQLGSKIPRLLLQELDLILGEQKASKSFEDWQVMDWGGERFIKGAYSYCPPGADGYHEYLADPLGDKVFFAGEATNFLGHHGTVHGAMESAERTAKQIFKLFEIKI